MKKYISTIFAIALTMTSLSVLAASPGPTPDIWATARRLGQLETGIFELTRDQMQIELDYAEEDLKSGRQTQERLDKIKILADIFDAMEDKSVIIASATTRKQPAPIGSEVVYAIFINEFQAIVSVKVEETFRGQSYENLDAHESLFGKTEPKPGKEYIAAKIKVSYLSVDNLSNLNMDPMLRVSVRSGFDLISSSGRRYDNTLGYLTNYPGFLDVYEGASTTGYIFAEIDEGDDPVLSYIPNQMDYTNTSSTVGWFEL